MEKTFRYSDKDRLAKKALSMLEDPFDPRPYSLPEGYMENLRSRLAEIPARQELSSRRVPLFQRILPYVAVAASFVLMVTVGNALLRLATPSLTSDEEVFEFAYVNRSSDSFLYNIAEEDQNVPEEDGLSDEEIEEYLILSGISTEHVNFTAYNDETH